MEIYNLNGVIIRHFERTAQLTEVEVEFLWTKEEDQLVFSLAAFYLAFVDRLSIDFVFSSYTRSKVMLFTRDFDDSAKRTLIDAVVQTRDHAATLFGLAKKLFWNNPVKATVETNRSDALAPLRKTDFKGKELVEAFAAALAKKG
jgi:hypothetical protein